eukprot:5139142-Alexandrium_andersonii.AAC.1
MSASLVGSEMCIRDRRTALNMNTFVGVNMHVRPARPPFGGWRTLAACQDCLLYTSEAADDM